jgi:hypothetical protein
MALKLIELSDSGSAVDADYERSSTRSYYAWFDHTDDENTVRNSIVVGGIAIDIGSAHPTDVGQRCLGITVASDGQEACPLDSSESIKWKIEVSYGLWNILERSPDGNPIHIPLRFRFEFTGVSTPAFVDVDGNAIVNSAGDYYDPPVEYERLHASLVVRRNESAPNINLVAAWSNTVNLKAWNGFPPKTARLMPIRIPEIMYSQVTNSFYWPMEYEFEINFDTWVKQILNQGFRQLDAEGQLVPIFINGQPIDTPLMLDEDGHAILTPAFVDSSGDTPPDANSGGTADDPAGGGEPPEGGDGTDDGETGPGVIINAYDIYRTMDFSASSGGLNMDNLFTLPGI